MSETTPIPSPELQDAQQVQGHAALGGIRRLLHWRRSGQQHSSDEPVSAVAPETTQPVETAESYQYLESVLSDESLTARKQLIEDEIASNPRVSLLHQLRESAHKNAYDWQEAHRTGDSQAKDRNDAEYRSLREQIDTFSPDEQTKESSAAYKLERIQKVRGYVADRDEPVAQSLLDYLATAPALQDAIDQAPFAHSKSNTQEVWKAVDAEEARSFLESRRYVSHTDINSARKPDGTAGKVILFAESGKEFEVPIGLVVNAAGFNSWVGGGAGYAKENLKSPYGDEIIDSHDVIKHYASLPTDIPPVGAMEVFVQPDGKMFCANIGGDSHRMAAAMLKGDSFIKAKELQFTPLAANVIE